MIWNDIENIVFHSLVSFPDEYELNIFDCTFMGLTGDCEEGIYPFSPAAVVKDKGQEIIALCSFEGSFMTFDLKERETLITYPNEKTFFIEKEYETSVLRFLIDTLHHQMWWRVIKALEATNLRSRSMNGFIGFQVEDLHLLFDENDNKASYVCAQRQGVMDVCYAGLFLVSRLMKSTRHRNISEFFGVIPWWNLARGIIRLSSNFFETQAVRSLGTTKEMGKIFYSSGKKKIILENDYDVVAAMMASYLRYPLDYI